MIHFCPRDETLLSPHIYAFSVLSLVNFLYPFFPQLHSKPSLMIYCDGQLHIFDVSRWMFCHPSNHVTNMKTFSAASLRVTWRCFWVRWEVMCFRVKAKSPVMFCFTFSKSLSDSCYLSPVPTLNYDSCLSIYMRLFDVFLWCVGPSWVEV